MYFLKNLPERKENLKHINVVSPCERELISIVGVIKRGLDGFLLLPQVVRDFEMIPKYFSSVLTHNTCIFHVS